MSLSFFEKQTTTSLVKKLLFSAGFLRTPTIAVASHKTWYLMLMGILSELVVSWLNCLKAANLIRLDLALSSCTSTKSCAVKLKSIGALVRGSSSLVN